MKVTLSKFLLYLFLFSALTPAQFREELAKVPAFWGHFKSHQALNPDISFVSFLEMHYGQGFLGHRADHDHGSLPMKSPCTHTHAPGQPLFSTICAFQLAIPEAPLGQQPVFTKHTYQFTHLNDIWQPPKFC